MVRGSGYRDGGGGGGVIVVAVVGGRGDSGCGNGL